jgi:hypothetical protein
VFESLAWWDVGVGVLRALSRYSLRSDKPLLESPRPLDSRGSLRSSGSLPLVAHPAVLTSPCFVERAAPFSPALLPVRPGVRAWWFQRAGVPPHLPARASSESKILMSRRIGDSPTIGELLSKRLRESFALPNAGCGSARRWRAGSASDGARALPVGGTGWPTNCSPAGSAWRALASPRDPGKGRDAARPVKPRPWRNRRASAPRRRRPTQAPQPSEARRGAQRGRSRELRSLVMTKDAPRLSNHPRVESVRAS